MMDKRTIVELLRGTLDYSRQKEATAKLDEMHKIIGFAPLLLEVVVAGDVEMPARQSGAVYLKNMISGNWMDSERRGTAGSSSALSSGSGFNIHEQDRALIRQKVVDAAVHSPGLIRQQLVTAIKDIVRWDFPDRWTDIVDKVSVYLQTPAAHDVWYGTLCCLHQLTSVFEYHEEKRRAPLVEAMQLLLPLVHQLLAQLMADLSEPAALVQKMALKVFYRYIHRHLPQQQLDRDKFTRWMELVGQLAERPLPPSVMAVDEEERPMLAWCKCRKWAVRVLLSTFERYGRPGRVTTRYEQMACWYVKAFTPGTLRLLLQLLHQNSSGADYLPPIALHMCFDYLETCVGLSYTWKQVKPHILAIIKDFVFPLLCFSDRDAKLWQDDPYEFIRAKYDYTCDYMTPLSSASALLESVTNKRKGVLKEMMAFVVQILTAPAPNPCHLDGALHLVGIVNEKLLKKDLYKSQMESMMVTHVFPLFNSAHGFLRARACWLTGSLCQLRYQCDDSVARAVQGLLGCLLADESEPPVQVEAAVALAALVDSQSGGGSSSGGGAAGALVQPHLQAVFVRVIEMIGRAEHSELTDVLQQLVRCFHEQLVPMALLLAGHVLDSFRTVAGQLSGDGEGDQREEVAAGLLVTMDLLMDVWEDEKETTAQLEPLFVQAVSHVLQRRITFLYDDALRLVTSLTTHRVTEPLWLVLQLMYQVFNEEGGDEHFDSMMPSLHNYISQGTDAMLADAARLEAVFSMCRRVVTGDTDSVQQCHAVKLLECIVLQCAGRIDQCLPQFIQVAVDRMTREIDSESLRVMCLQLLIAVLYTQPQLLLTSFSSLQLPNSQLPLIDHFIKQWLDDHVHFTGVHDRKLFVLGWCVLLSGQQLQQQQLEAVHRHMDRIMTVLLAVLSALQRAYQERAKEEGESETEDESDIDSLDEDEDEVVDEGGDQCLEMLQKRIETQSTAAGVPVTAAVINGGGKVSNGNDSVAIDDDEIDVGEDDEEDDDDDDDSSVYDYLDNYEDYTTPLDAADCTVDEFVVFRQTVEALQQQHAPLYGALVAPLGEEQRRQLQQVFTTAEQRRAAAHAEAIKKQGGYNFEQKNVPNSFNFGTGSVQFGGNC